MLTALTQVVPDARVTSDPLNKTLIIAASKEDHAIIKPIIDDSDRRGGGDPVIKSYTLKFANPTYLITALKQVLPDAIVAIFIPLLQYSCKAAFIFLSGAFEPSDKLIV